jgi:hypothetical protein
MEVLLARSDVYLYGGTGNLGDGLSLVDSV